jgi:hypothetical protein
MATWEDIKTLVQSIADGIDDPGAYGMRSPGPDIEIQRNIEVTPGGSWGSTKAFEIFLKGLSEYLDTQDISAVGDIKDKLNELISSYAQLKADYNAGTVPTTAPDVVPLP